MFVSWLATYQSNKKLLKTSILLVQELIDQEIVSFWQKQTTTKLLSKYDPQNHDNTICLLFHAEDFHNWTCFLMYGRVTSVCKSCESINLSSVFIRMFVCLSIALYVFLPAWLCLPVNRCFFFVGNCIHIGSKSQNASM